MEKIILTRVEFYNLVWGAPLSQLAKKYAISDNGLRKMCQKYQVPIPKNGYWIKLKFNKPVKPEKLPPLDLEKDAIEIILRDQDNPFTMDASPETLLVREIKTDSMAPLTVPQELVKPHLLIKETKRHWADRKKHRRDFNYDQTIPHLSIDVTEELQDRALLFFDALIKLLEYRGHKVITKGFETSAVLGNIEIKLALREASNRVYRTEGRYPTSDLVRNGILVLKTGQYSFEKEWRDNKTKIESMLPKILAKLELDAKAKTEQKERARLNAIKREEEERLRRENEALRRAEQQKLEVLLDQADRLETAAKIRRLITAASQKALANGPLSQEMQQWIQWASDKADHYDPLSPPSADILNP